MGPKNTLSNYVLEKTIKRPKKFKSVTVNIVRKYHNVKKMSLKYQQFLPLYNMWKGYYTSVMGNCKDDRLLKADYHGCLIHVSYALNPSQIGLRGIIIRESKQTFLLITPNNRLLCIPKEGGIFHFILSGRLFTLYGENFRCSAAGRVQKKFKGNAVIPRLLDEDFHFSENSLLQHKIAESIK